MQSFVTKFNFHSSKFMPYWNWLKIYVHCVCSATSQNPKPLTNYLKIKEASVALIIFDCVLYQVRAYTVPVSYRPPTQIRYQKSFIRFMITYYSSNNLQLRGNLGYKCFICTCKHGFPSFVQTYCEITTGETKHLHPINTC